MFGGDIGRIVVYTARVQKRLASLTGQHAIAHSQQWIDETVHLM